MCAVVSESTGKETEVPVIKGRKIRYKFKKSYFLKRQNVFTIILKMLYLTFSIKYKAQKYTSSVEGREHYLFLCCSKNHRYDVDCVLSSLLLTS